MSLKRIVQFIGFISLLFSSSMGNCQIANSIGDPKHLVDTSKVAISKVINIFVSKELRRGDSTIISLDGFDDEIDTVELYLTLRKRHIYLIHRKFISGDYQYNWKIPKKNISPSKHYRLEAQSYNGMNGQSKPFSIRLTRRERFALYSVGAVATLSFQILSFFIDGPSPDLGIRTGVPSSR